MSDWSVDRVLEQEDSQSFFCQKCGCLLPPPSFTSKWITCSICTHRVAASQALDKSSVSKVEFDSKKEAMSLSDMAPFLDKLGGERQQKSMATISVDCPNCAAQVVNYYTKQLRGADEGQTIFYECPDCDHKWNENS